jgi:Lon protease-like protein
MEVTHVFDDGRLNIVAEGRERFRLLHETEGRSFRTGEIEPVDDEEPGPGPPDDVEQVLELFARLVAVTSADVDAPAADVPALSFAIAARVDFGSAAKQELLELRSEPERLRRLASLLTRAVEALALEREVRDRASRNGRVSPRHP